VDYRVLTVNREFGSGGGRIALYYNVLGSGTASDLGTAPVSAAYVSTDSDTPGIFAFGSNGTADVSYTSLWAHGNYDTVTPGVVWNSSIATHDLPASLYRSAKPSWWTAGKAWPWVGPDLDPRVQTLPAKARADALAQ